MTPKQELWVDMVTPSEQEPPEKGGVIFEKTLGTCHAVERLLWDPKSKILL